MGVGESVISFGQSLVNPLCSNREFQAHTVGSNYICCILKQKLEYEKKICKESVDREETETMKGGRARSDHIVYVDENVKEQI